MKKICLLLFFGSLFLNCNGQKKVIIENDTLKTLEKLEDYVSADKSLSRDSFSNGVSILQINELGLYQYTKDSTLFNGKLRIALLKDLNNDTGPRTYGYLSGNIINGKKQGEWKKEIYIGDNSTNKIYATVKVANYSHGTLHGKYQIYNLNGEILTPNNTHPLFPEEYKDYSTFKNGTGRYYDYYYDSGVLKEEGYYLNGKKHLDWIIYDKKGNQIKRDHYINGVLINN